SIPDAAAEALTVPARDGLALRLYRLRRGRPDAPVLLWGHANGFAAGSYLPFLQELEEHVRVFAFDARGHGGSERPPAPFAETLHLDRYAEDVGLHLMRVREAVGDAPLFFAAHSFSGVAALRLGAIRGIAPWRAVVLFEPPLVPTPEHPEHAVAMATGRALVAGAQRRRRRWADPAAFAESLGRRVPYANFRPDMLEAHCRASLRPTGDGDFELCCAPEVEMATYDAVDDFTTFSALPSFPCPVHYV
ncbi:MAG: alpha/beta fold hydrolase, partial [Alphaproteobacteria bacterium]